MPDLKSVFGEELSKEFNLIDEENYDGKPNYKLIEDLSTDLPEECQ